MIKHNRVPLYCALLTACGALIFGGVSLSTPPDISAQSPPNTQLTSELSQATALTQTVVKLFAEGKVDEALPLATRALEIRERLLPGNDPLIELSLLYQGDLYFAKKNYRASRSNYERVLKMREARLGSQDVTLATVFDRLAVVYYKDGTERESEKAYCTALALREKKLGPESSEVAATLYALGELYRAQSNPKRGLEVYKRALTIYGRLKGTASQDFEKVRLGFTCLAFQTEQHSVVKERLKELEEVRSQFPTPVTDILTVDEPLNGKALRLPKPDYPPQARAHLISGVVVLKVLIDEEGNVIRASDACEGPPFLTESCLKAAREAKFAPTQRDGKPVKVSGVLGYRFVRQ
jgi:TonB family protein